MASSSVAASEPGEASSKKFREVDRKEGFGGLIQQVDLQSRKQYGGLEEYLTDLTEYLKELIKPILKDKGGINFWLSIQVIYRRGSKEAKVDRSIYLHTGKLVIFPCVLEGKLKQAMDVILQRNYSSHRDKSGLIIDSIPSARFKIVDYLPLETSRYNIRDATETADLDNANS